MKMAASDMPLLVTIPTSHFCEKARWGLERAGIAFEERGHLPYFSRLATLRAGRWSTVPLLRGADGELVADSTEILRWVDARVDASHRLYPEEAAARRAVEELEERFDLGVGPAARVLAYALILPQTRLALRVARRGVPLAEWLGLAASLPLARLGIRRMYGVNPEGVARARRLLDEELADVSRMLADGRRHLTGERFTAADLTFASLLAPALLPEGVAGLPRLDELPDAGRAEIEGYRATPAGAYALRLYTEERARVA
jgi:glutathione S-transferase